MMRYVLNAPLQFSNVFVIYCFQVLGVYIGIRLPNINNRVLFSGVDLQDANLPFFQRLCGSEVLRGKINLEPLAGLWIQP